ncbi:hypothetical protein PDIG_17320 [Penicillium digitatum PHI26]|uniref:Uncharacterized protein n=2 Tax=Penicillium digitatum TaxID=36651 RepID=K9GQS5_PEND2|nr:hypothetical protein PDIP_55220 [Penicillium digitatum Pd1]EKV11701.1 hypothetical protein PDIP_55220 [Penicillium digitatum Pd1]EKV17018.1 hypothetical protein PDIG_17320 [Penicillium digitatum PHI26]
MKYGRYYRFTRAFFFNSSIWKCFILFFTPKFEIFLQRAFLSSPNL